MNFELVSALQLSAQHERDWSSLIKSNEHIRSPFFTLEFARAVARARDDVRILCIENGGDYVCFFPFHIDKFRVGRPLGIRISDFHGLITAPDAQWDMSMLLRYSGLRVWHFNHLIESQRFFSPFVLRHAESAFLDLSYGYDSYAKSRRLAGSNQLSQLERKARKIAREVGPLRFEWHTDKAEVFDLLRRWKSLQRKETQTFNVLDYDWVLALLEEIRHIDTSDFGGVLSTLYAGENLVAVHLGIRSHSVFHYWFPAYDSAFSRYSPGAILLSQIAQTCPQLGLLRLDLGKGNERYKKSFKSGITGLGVGAVDFRPLNSTARRFWFSAVAWGRESRLRQKLAVPKRLLERVSGDSEMK